MQISTILNASMDLCHEIQKGHFGRGPDQLYKALSRDKVNILQCLVPHVTGPEKDNEISVAYSDDGRRPKMSFFDSLTFSLTYFNDLE